MESTVSSDLAECTPAAAALDAGRIKSSPQSFDDSPDAGESAVAATSTTTDELSSIDLGASAASTCWPPAAAAGRDNSQHYLAAASSYDCVTPALYSASQHDFVPMPRTSCYQPWCLSAEHYHHNLFT